MPPRNARLVVLAAGFVLALLVPAVAGAHAFLLRSEPSAGSELARPPRSVRLFFDEGVRPAPGIEVVRNGGGSVLAGRPLVPAGRPTEIVLPLRPRLERGDYTVRWREIDVDDGHLIAGAFAFKVGAGGPPPSASLSAGSGNPPFHALVTRWLLLVGLLVAAGTTMFSLLVWRPVLRKGGRALPEARLRLAEPVILAVALALAALAASLSVALEPGTSGTTYGHRMEIGAVVAAAAALAAVASFRMTALRRVAGIAALVLLALPTVTGHALQHGVLRAVSVPADLVHLAAAAFWIGGSLELVLVAPFVLRGPDVQGRRTGLQLVLRYSRLAAVAVALVGLSGVIRAFGELSSLDQLWTTGYGRTLLVKTGILAGLTGLGWLNRYRLTPALARNVEHAEPTRATARRLRRSVGTELALLAVALAAVAVLTNIRPGRDYVSPGTQAAAPSRQTVVLAAQDEALAVGLGITRGGGSRLALRATVLGPNGPTSGLGLRFIVNGAAAHFALASPCGPGCYQARTPSPRRLGPILLRIEAPGRRPTTLTFTPPTRLPAPPAATIVRRAAAKIHHLRTLVIHSHLASDGNHEVTTTYREVAPNRLAYRNSDGSAAIIIGDRRWDRSPPGGRWHESPQQPPIRQPVPFWPTRFADAHLLRVTQIHGHPVWVVSFLDPTTPAWFTLWIDRRTYQTLRLDMIATAHFMHNSNGRFNGPTSVEPPAAH
jgi:copper transport protein